MHHAKGRVRVTSIEGVTRNDEPAERIVAVDLSPLRHDSMCVLYAPPGTYTVGAEIRVQHVNGIWQPLPDDPTVL